MVGAALEADRPVGAVAKAVQLATDGAACLLGPPPSPTLCLVHADPGGCVRVVGGSLVAPRAIPTERSVLDRGTPMALTMLLLCASRVCIAVRAQR